MQTWTRRIAATSLGVRYSTMRRGPPGSGTRRARPEILTRHSEEGRPLPPEPVHHPIRQPRAEVLARQVRRDDGRQPLPLPEPHDLIQERLDQAALLGVLGAEVFRGRWILSILLFCRGGLGRSERGAPLGTTSRNTRVIRRDEKWPERACKPDPVPRLRNRSGHGLADPAS